MSNLKFTLTPSLNYTYQEPFNGYDAVEYPRDKASHSSRLTLVAAYAAPGGTRLSGGAEYSLDKAILADNAAAQATYPTGLVKIDAPGSLVIRRETIEELVGRSFDLQQIHVNLVTLSGHIDEDDDQLSLKWNN